jgi:hypothetical protein
MSDQVLSGGCQCGAVRFRVAAPLGEASVCYCRMCQKATGGAFGLYVRVAADKFEWTRGEPARFATSNVAERGFCRDCGTPLTWEYADGFDLTVAAFDKAAEIAPTVQMRLESRFAWLSRLRELPVRRNELDPEYAAFLKSVISHQHPDYDTADWPPQGSNG